MADIGVLNEPFTLDAPELVMPIPVGDLVTPFEAVVLDGVSEIISNRFPVPPVAAAFLTMVLDEEGNDPFRISTVTGNPIIGALVSEGNYLEPTIGQIWPR